MGQNAVRTEDWNYVSLWSAIFHIGFCLYMAGSLGLAIYFNPGDKGCVNLILWSVLIFDLLLANLFAYRFYTDTRTVYSIVGVYQAVIGYLITTLAVYFWVCYKKRTFNSRKTL